MRDWGAHTIASPSCALCLRLSPPRFAPLASDSCCRVRSCTRGGTCPGWTRRRARGSRCATTLTPTPRHPAARTSPDRPPSSPYPQLEEATELQLPLWLVDPLVTRRHVDLQLPKFYGEAYRHALRADASHLNLCSQSDYYFDVGVQLSRLYAPRPPRKKPVTAASMLTHRVSLWTCRLDDSGGLGDQLLAGFANRFHGLLDASLNVTSKVDSTAIKEKLTLREKQLFDAGRDASAQYNTWKAAKTRGRIEQASIVGHQPRKGKGKKRSRDASASSS